MRIYYHFQSKQISNGLRRKNYFVTDIILDSIISKIVSQNIQKILSSYLTNYYLISLPINLQKYRNIDYKFLEKKFLTKIILDSILSKTEPMDPSTQRIRSKIWLAMKRKLMKHRTLAKSPDAWISKRDRTMTTLATEAIT